MPIIESTFSCAACGKTNDLFVDPTGGESQTYVEDCRICCRPNVLVIRCDLETGTCSAEATVEGE